MSIQRTPTYDKSHYSWQPPSAQASQSILDHEQSGDSGAAGGGHGKGEGSTREVMSSYFHLPTQLPDALEDEQLNSPTGLPKRSTFNYQHSSEEYQKKLDEDQAAAEADEAGKEEFVAGRRGSITSKPFKPGSKRTKSWDLRDKRGETQMSYMHNHDDELESKQGFSET